ncbi:MAG: SsrA-binding protein SmpB [Chloroflexota bacterium]|nr:SsrA-binding protein SmpB [Chloroflexota bacterium]
MSEEHRKVITANRKAFHDYHILERLEAGLVLTGTEIKSVRSGRVNIREAFAKFQDGELWLNNCHIAKYESGGYANHDPLRKRKLLLHRDELLNLKLKLDRKGLTLVLLLLYIKGHVAKVELALAQGKKQYDKRQAIMQQDMDREAQRADRQSQKS